MIRFVNLEGRSERGHGAYERRDVLVEDVELLGRSVLLEELAGDLSFCS